MRLDEHKRDKTSVIATHCNSNRHTFNFGKPQVLDEESAWGKHKVSESLHIQLAHPTINKKEDTDNLNPSYIHTINTLNQQHFK